QVRGRKPWQSQNVAVKISTGRPGKKPGGSQTLGSLDNRQETVEGRVAGRLVGRGLAAGAGGDAWGTAGGETKSRTKSTSVTSACQTRFSKVEGSMGCIRKASKAARSCSTSSATCKCSERRKRRAVAS